MLAREHLVEDRLAFGLEPAEVVDTRHADPLPTAVLGLLQCQLEQAARRFLVRLAVVQRQRRRRLGRIPHADPAHEHEHDGDRGRDDPLVHDSPWWPESDDPSLPTALSRSEEHTSELQSLMRTSYAVFCLKKK